MDWCHLKIPLNRQKLEVGGDDVKEDILISIIIPAYNAEKTIDEAIQSVFQQTYQKWELIIINDCSSDKTEEFVKKYLDQNNKIIFLNNEKNLGVSATRNKGIAASKGEWIAFLDSDDKWNSEKLEKQVRLIKKNKMADLVFTGIAFINHRGLVSQYLLEVPESIGYRQLLKQNLIYCSSVMVKKELVINYRMQNDKMHEDYAVWLQLLKDGYHAFGINEPLLIYRVSENSKSRNKRYAAKMTYRVYRFMKLNCIECVYFFMIYAVRNIYKYKKIREGFLNG